MADKNNTETETAETESAPAVAAPKTGIVNPKTSAPVKVEPKITSETPGIHFWEGQGGQYHIDEKGVYRKGPKPDKKA